MTQIEENVLFCYGNINKIVFYIKIVRNLCCNYSGNYNLFITTVILFQAGGLDLKENLASGAATWPYHSVYHPYDAAFAGYPFNG